MNLYQKLSTLGGCAIATQLTALPEFAAEPNVLGNCAACHATPAAEQTAGGEWSGVRDGSWVNGRFSVDPGQTALDLGMQLDGQELGALQTYLVQPGETVRPSVTATNLSGSTSFVIRGLEAGGVKVSQDNSIDFTYDTLGSDDPPWIPQDIFVLPSWQIFYTWAGIGPDTPGPDQVEFPMIIAESTPEDVYLLTFGLSIFEGDVLHYEEHSFYLQVGSGGLNEATWGDYSLTDDVFVDTGSWMGWLALFDPSGAPTWAYSFELDDYFFFPSPITANGSWTYLLTDIASTGTSGATWGAFDITDSIFVNTGSWLGWLSLFDTSGAPTWAYSFDLGDYFFFTSPPAQSDSGIWIYAQRPAN